MLKNYVLVALRTMRRQKNYALINVCGLALGLAACFIVGLYIHGELSYDRFHENTHRIYRMGMKVGAMGGSARLPAVVGERIAAQYPEVRAIVRLYPSPAVVQLDGDDRQEERFFYADASLFDVFTFPLLRGDVSTALLEPGSVVLTEETGRRYFGNMDPIGQMLLLNDGTELRVTGVAANVPANSHLQFDFLASFSTLGDLDAYPDYERAWGYQSLTYLLLTNSRAAGSLAPKLAEVTGGDVEQMQQALGFGIAGMDLGLQPLAKIHLHPFLSGAVQPEGNLRYLYIFGAIALSILLISCINYMNMATARSVRRSREVGIRKALGARRGQLVRQFLAESLLFSILALLGALCVVKLALPYFNALTGAALSLEIAESLQIAAIFAIAAVIAGLIGGSYPALVLSRFSPVRVLKGIPSEAGEVWFRRGLVTFQFVVSIALIAGTAVMHEQLNYMREKPLGYETEQILALPLQGISPQRAEAFRRELHRIPGIERVSLASGTPDGYLTTAVEHRGEQHKLHYTAVDHEYVPAMGLRLVAGRNFREATSGTSSDGVIVNETAARVFSLDIGQRADLGMIQNADVIGIVGDYHAGSLRDPIRPTAFTIEPAYYSTIIVRVEPGESVATLSELQKMWESFVPDEPLQLHFLDETLDARYRSEQRLAGIFGAFSFLAVLIACLGLFGLAAFVAERRTKEIGIRKVLGARVRDVVVLISKEFIILIIAAFLIAAPLSYWAISRWLEDYAYRVTVGLDTLLFAGVLALAIGLVTVSYQAIRAALSDPVRSLHRE